VPDADAAFARAVEGGAHPAMEVMAQEDGSRMGGFVDPFRTLWWASTSQPGATRRFRVNAEG
jgi:PhnB protein